MYLSQTINYQISDRFNIIQDPQMPFLKDALNPHHVDSVFRRLLPWLNHSHELAEIRVIRYKPQRRCLIEYHFQGEQPLIIIGKVRAKGTDTKSYFLQKELWHNGFDDRSTDQISVPEPLGIIPQWQMWLQRKVSGEVATPLMATAQGIEIAKKVAHVTSKLHQLRICPERHHTMSHELAILHQKLPEVIRFYPHWQNRIQSLLVKCDRLGANTPQNELCGIHRDFYPEQIIVDGDRLYLLDLDLYCQGDPALDIGNFIAHISEYSLRALGHLDALYNREFALVEEFIKLRGDRYLQGIIAYINLTLVRHIYLSTQFSERQRYTEVLLNLCEQRLG